MTTRSTLAQIRRDIEKKYGPGAIINGAELKNRVIQRITTGSLSLDVMLGGGWPVNHFNEIVGEFSSGKTSLVYKTIAANQALDPKWFVVWVASEPFVAEWAEAAGCDLARFEIIDDNVIESAFTMLLMFVENHACDWSHRLAASHAPVGRERQRSGQLAGGTGRSSQQQVLPSGRLEGQALDDRGRARLHLPRREPVPREDRCDPR
jgi:hypothetical protein